MSGTDRQSACALSPVPRLVVLSQQPSEAPPRGLPCCIRALDSSLMPDAGTGGGRLAWIRRHTDSSRSTQSRDSPPILAIVGLDSASLLKTTTCAVSTAASLVSVAAFLTFPLWVSIDSRCK